MNSQQAAGVSILIGASFLVWNLYKSKQRNDKQRTLTAGITEVREIAERARPRVRFAQSDTVLSPRRRSVSCEIEYRHRLSSASASLVTLPAGDGQMAAPAPSGGSEEPEERPTASPRAWSPPAAERDSLSPKTRSGEMIDHDPSAIIHPVLDHSKGVDETDETQFFAYTMGQGLFRSGPPDPEEDPNLSLQVNSAPSSGGGGQGKGQASRWRPPQKRRQHAITFKRQQKFGVDVRPFDTDKTDFSFVLVCTTDEEIPLACTTALSLRKEGTSASIVCILATPADITPDRRMLLQLHMDEILQAVTVADQTPLGPLLADRPQLALLLLWKLPRWRCVYVSNNCLALRCADALFHAGAEFAAVQAPGLPSLDTSMFSAKPSPQAFLTLVNMAAAAPTVDVPELLNTYLSSATHLSRLVLEGDVPERFCRVSVVYNFSLQRLEGNAILPSVKIFNFSSCLPAWLESGGVPDDAPAVVARLFARWSALHAIIDPDLPTVAGSGGSSGTPLAAAGALGDVTKPFEAAPWQPTPQTVEELVTAERRAEKIKPTTETYGRLAQAKVSF